jgi:hypothetical protein
MKNWEVIWIQTKIKSLSIVAHLLLVVVSPISTTTPIRDDGLDQTMCLLIAFLNLEGMTLSH